jgi:hypothetical protein
MYCSPRACSAYGDSGSRHVLPFGNVGLPYAGQASVDDTLHPASRRDQHASVVDVPVPGRDSSTNRGTGNRRLMQRSDPEQARGAVGKVA